MKQKEHIGPELLKVREACQALSICRAQLYVLIKRGKIRTVKIGKCGVRIPQSEIDRFVQSELDRNEGGAL